MLNIIADIPSKFWDENILTMIDGIKGMLSGAMFVGTAKEIAAILSLIYLSVKAYAMILGEGKFEVMPLFRPFVLTLAIVNFGLYAGIVGAPGSSAEDEMKTVFMGNATVMDDLMQTKQTASDLLFDNIMAHTNEAKAPIVAGMDALTGGDPATINGLLHPLDKASAEVSHAANGLQATLVVWERLLWVKVSMVVQGWITGFVLALFKGVAYCIFFIQLILMHILLILGPISFAFSIIGAFRDSWIQWTARYVAVSFYGTIAFIVLNIALVIINYGFRQEISRLDQINALNDYAAQFIRAVDHTDNFVGYLMIGLLVTIGGLLSIPEVTSWILSAGTSGSVLHGTAVGTARAAGSAAVNAAKTAGKAATTLL